MNFRTNQILNLKQGSLAHLFYEQSENICFCLYVMLWFPWKDDLEISEVLLYPRRILAKMTRCESIQKIYCKCLGQVWEFMRFLGIWKLQSFLGSDVSFQPCGCWTWAIGEKNWQNSLMCFMSLRYRAKAKNATCLLTVCFWISEKLEDNFLLGRKERNSNYVT